MISRIKQLQMDKKHILRTQNLAIKYGDVTALSGVNLTFPYNKITGIIGPSGCGKSTFLRSLNRMNDFIANTSISGDVIYKDINVYQKDTDPVFIRRHIGMVFQKPNPFPKSIFQNIAWGLTLEEKPKNLAEQVEWALTKAYLFDEVKDRLHESALSLSGGQQQRLCIARSIAIKPDILLLDEPCSSLDPKSTAKIEELLESLKESMTIIIVTHNMQQAKRIADEIAFFDSGTLIEVGDGEQIFSNPKHQRTQDYTNGVFG